MYVIVIVLLIVIIGFLAYNQFNPEKPKEPENKDCVGYYETVTCPTSCGYAGGEIRKNFIVTQPASGTGTPCPTSQTVTCPATSACVPNQNCVGYYETVTCPTTCGYAGGEIRKNFIVTQPASGTGASCPANQSVTCPATPACVFNQDCLGSYENVTCPTTCGYAGGEIRKNFIVTQPASGTGTPCPTSQTVTCPATSPCSPVVSSGGSGTGSTISPGSESAGNLVYVVKNCVWGSNNPQGGPPVCLISNQYPGTGTCYKKPLDMTMYKRIDPDTTDPETVTRCFNPSNGEGDSVENSLGNHTLSQAQAACEAIGMRVPRTVDEVGATCGTGFGYDSSYVWTLIGSVV
jgi:hypothetical protein